MEDLEDYAGVMNGLRSLWEQGLFLDYTIEVEDQEFKVHKLILACVSDYFKAMFSVGMKESETDRVRLEGISAAAFSILIDFIYKGELYVNDVDKVSLEELTQCAVYLQVQTAIEDCIDYADCDTCEGLYDELFPRLSTYQTYSLKVGIEKTTALMISNFDKLLEAWTPEEMTHHDLRNLIDIWQNSEWDLFTIKQWVELDIENRQQHVNDLMSHLRFGLMTPEQLEVLRASDLYSGCDGLWHEDMYKAVEYHRLPIHEKVLDDSEQSMARNDPHPLYFNSDGNILYTLMKGENKSWTRREAVEKPEMKHGIETFVVVNNFLIVCEAFHANQKWHVFDPRMMKWSSIAEPAIPRQDFTVVSCNKDLYVLGGYLMWPPNAPLPTDIIERYDFITDSWSVIPSKLPVAVCKHGAAVIGSSIYVAGGLISDDNSSSRLDCFDTSTDTWHSKKSLPFAGEVFKLIQVMEDKNEKVLFIMRDGRHILYYSPTRDAWFEEDCAQVVYGRREGRELSWHDDAAVFSNQNKLFLLNFIEADKRDDGTEDYERKVGACAVRTMHSEQRGIFECRLDRLPVNYAGLEEYQRAFTRLMLLAVPPPPSAPLNVS